MRRIGFITIALAGVLFACNDDDDYGTTEPPPPPPPPVATVITASGDIATKVEEFRTSLGPSNGATAGEQVGGRREINWDGAAANPFNNRNDFPANFFNSNVKAGGIYTTPGTGFRNDSLLFAEVNPTYAAQFSAFLKEEGARLGEAVRDKTIELKR